MSDSSDYKSDKSETTPEPEVDTTFSPGSRGDDDMANVPTVEEIPVPMSRNNVGSRWIALVFDRDLHKMYNGEVWEGESGGSGIDAVSGFEDELEADDDDDDDGIIDLVEDDEEEVVEEVNVKLPVFKDEDELSEAYTDWKPEILQIIERKDQEVVWDETNNDHILWKMHYQRTALTEKHVMWARKQNLYNETFNTESMADVLWSHQL